MIEIVGEKLLGSGELDMLGWAHGQVDKRV